MQTNISNLPLLHSGTKIPMMRPLKAYKHFRNLVADKEDTAEVFHIIEALSGRSIVRNTRKFLKSSNAQDIMERNIDLPAILDDHDTLRKLPANSLGQAYVRFMEKEELTAAGLVAEFDRYGEGRKKRGDLTEWYGSRLRDTHDLYHVLTGYGRDALGEQCVLGFSNRHAPNLGILFITYAGGFETKKVTSNKIPVFGAIHQSQKLGKAAKNLPHQNVEKLLAMPLDEARAFLNIGEPTLYYKAHEILRNQGIDPYDMSEKSEAFVA